MRLGTSCSNSTPPTTLASPPTTLAPPVDGSAQLSLPWPTGETWSLTGGPHPYATYSGSPTRSSLDFGGGSGNVSAARDGIARVDCKGSRVRIEHRDGWSTSYYHLANVPSNIDGQTIARGHPIGRISTSAGCGGTASGPHVHFTVYRNNAEVSLNGMAIGGWTVEQASENLQGCMRRIRDGARVCATGTMANDGTIGSGGGPAGPAGYTFCANEGQRCNLEPDCLRRSVRCFGRDPRCPPIDARPQVRSCTGSRCQCRVGARPAVVRRRCSWSESRA